MISEHKRAAGMGDSQHATAVHWEAAAVVVDRSSRWWTGPAGGDSGGSRTESI